MDEEIERSVMFTLSIQDMRLQIMRLIDAAMEHKAIVGRSRLTQRLDGSLGAVLVLLQEMQEYDTPLTVPMFECAALNDKVIRLADHRTEIRKGI